MVDRQETKKLLILLNQKIHPYGRDADFVRASEFKGSFPNSFVRQETNPFGSIMYAISSNGIDHLRKTIDYYREIIIKMLTTASYKTLRTLIAKEMMLAWRLESSAMLCPESSTKFIRSLQKCFKSQDNLPHLHRAATSIKNALIFNAMASKGVMIGASMLYTALFNETNREEMLKMVIKAIEGSITSFININIINDKTDENKHLYYEVNGWILAAERVAGTLYRRNQRGYSIVWEKIVELPAKNKVVRIMGGDYLAIRKEKKLTTGMVLGIDGGAIIIANNKRGIISMPIEILRRDSFSGKSSISTTG